jgi:hypothetical protein
MRRLYSLLLAVLVVIPALRAQINTDRPAFADSSVVVPKDSLQMENGFLDTVGTLDFPETLFRYGLTGKTELRFTAPDDYLSPSSYSDPMVGIKQQLGPIAGFDVSIVASVSFPNGVKPQFNLPWSRKLSKNWTAAGMLSVYWPVEGQATFLLDRQLTGPWDAFIEYAADLPKRGAPEHILHLGTSYKVTQNQQLDFHFGFGLSAAAPDHFIGFGYSVLFPLKVHSDPPPGKQP